MYVKNINKSFSGTSKQLSVVLEGGGSDRKQALERDESKKKERQTAEVDFLFLVALW